MPIKVFRIDLGWPKEMPVYKTSMKEVDAWVRRNPGICQTVEQVDPLEELERLADALDDALTETARLRFVIDKIQDCLPDL